MPPNGLRIGLRGWFFVEIDVRGGPRQSRWVLGSGSAGNPRKTGPKIRVILKDRGILLKDPGVLLKDPGVLLKDPGVP